MQGFGITHVGVSDASVLQRARDALHHRIDHDLTDGMQFTFRNPERSTDPQAAVAGAQSVLVAARPYLIDEPADTGTHRGRIARYAWADHYAPLREGLWAAAHRLRADGYRAVAYADDNTIVDREVAHRAGLGWFGKNANLLVSGAGSWFVLGCVVTTAPFAPNPQPAADGCGTCVRCLDACPTGAIVAPGVIDARRCLAWVLQKPGDIPLELRTAVGDRIYGCDDCQTACPPTVRLGVRAPGELPPGLSAAGLQASLDLVELLTAPDDIVMQRWGRRYLADRDPRWVRRNALVALGNSTAPIDARVAAVLADYRSHADPMLREHAVWATERLGLETR
jgi:epoxyqueuosine reductase